MTSVHRPAPFPGFEAPAAGFDEPMEMLHACHDRVRRSLELLRRIGERVAQGRVDAEVHRAAADVLRYFDQAAPNHHEDEEQHIFPLVLSRTDDARARAAVLKLQEDHLMMESQWARLRTPLVALAGGRAQGFGTPQIEAAARFRALYHDHARSEETLVFPIAAALLDEAALQAMGQEMAGRRGARWPGSRF